MAGGWLTLDNIKCTNQCEDESISEVQEKRLKIFFKCWFFPDFSCFIFHGKVYFKNLDLYLFLNVHFWVFLALRFFSFFKIVPFLTHFLFISIIRVVRKLFFHTNMLSYLLLVLLGIESKGQMLFKICFCFSLVGFFFQIDFPSPLSIVFLFLCRGVLTVSIAVVSLCLFIIELSEVHSVAVFAHMQSV